MKCAYCDYEDNGLNPFSKCLRCGQPFDMFDEEQNSETASEGTINLRS